MIHYDGVLTIAALKEFSGVAARRIAVARYRAQGLSWSQSRKRSLDAIADKKLETMLQVRITNGMHPKDAIYEVVAIINKEEGRV